uniref:Uncharacterized protein n=1 Tax=Vespula pensylvanica TaxID=30213 RepID=A0A834N311_VESPE|nr:hypothetical protein H0235_017067 [Vespula pensylvanica]
MLSSKHKSIKINNTETKYLRQLRIITKPNLASMLPIKWQESTALNQNPIDGLCMFFSTSLMWPVSTSENSLKGKTFTNGDNFKSHLVQFFANKDQNFYESGITKLLENWKSTKPKLLS